MTSDGNAAWARETSLAPPHVCGIRPEVRQ